MEITIDKDILSIKELDIVVREVLEELKRREKEENNQGDLKVEILCSRGVEKIDIPFIGGLLLLHLQNRQDSQNKSLPKNKLLFEIKGSWGNGPGYWNDVFVSDNHKYELFICLEQIKKLYPIADEKWIQIYGLKDSIPPKSKVSGYFAPVLFVHEGTMKWMFDSEDPQSDGYKNDFGGYKQEYIKKLKEGRDKDKNKNTQEVDYFAKNKSTVSDLERNSVLKTFVFYILFRCRSPFAWDRGNKAPEEIKSIWAFTEQFVSGLEELAKNIISHSEKKLGMITIRAYWDNKAKIRNLKTFVFDYGCVGIVPTMKQELELHKNRTEEDNEDLAVLSSGEYRLQDLMQRSDKLLFRQIHRGMAHLGLIHFASLIKSYDGFYSAATQGFGDVRDELGDNVGENNLSVGTNFHFTLPLHARSSKSRKPLLGPGILTTQKELIALTDFIQKKNTVQIVSYPLSIVKTREEEQQFLHGLTAPLKNGLFYAVNFEGIDISSTSLLRVLALLSQRLEISLIAFNIKTDTFCSMLKVNEEYFARLKDYKDVGYWLKGKSVLVYSYLENQKENNTKEGEKEREKRQENKDAKKSKGWRFCFADMLFGQTQKDFLGLNRVINQTFPNFVTISSTVDESIPFYWNRDLLAPALPYFSEMVLLPFDIILKRKEYGEKIEEISLFDNNLNYLLNKEINGTV